MVLAWRGAVLPASPRGQRETPREPRVRCRPMFRRLFTVLSTLSLLLCVVPIV